MRPQSKPSAQQQRESAESALRADLDLNTDIAVTQPNPALEPLPDEQTLVSRAEASRPDIAIAQNNIRVAEGDGTAHGVDAAALGVVLVSKRR